MSIAEGEITIAHSSCSSDRRPQKEHISWGFRVLYDATIALSPGKCQRRTTSMLFLVIFKMLMARAVRDEVVSRLDKMRQLDVGFHIFSTLRNRLIYQ